MPIQYGELVSVVIPTYNRSSTIVRAVHSVLSQSYQNLELIVVDDASNDNSVELLAEIDDARLRVIALDKNLGVSGATNVGVNAAKGNWVAFQDSDDEWLSGKLDLQIKRLERAPKNCVGVYCIKIVYGRDPQFNRGARRIACVPGPEVSMVEGDLATVLQKGNIISPQTAICRKRYCLEVGGFDQRLRCDQDWDFFSRLCEIGPMVFVDEPLVNTYLQNDSISLFSRKNVFCQIIICNKMRKRGIPIRNISHHLERIGFFLGKTEKKFSHALTILKISQPGRSYDFKFFVKFSYLYFLISKSKIVKFIEKNNHS